MCVPLKKTIQIYICKGIGSSRDLSSTELLKILCHMSFSGSL